MWVSMSDTPRHLRFRADERREVALAASLSLSDNDKGQLRFTAGVLDARSRINGTLVDISGGGAGLVVGEFVPKWARVTVRVHRSEDDSASLATAEGVVRRVQMLDRRPSYLIGVGFDKLTDDEIEQIAGLIANIDGLEVERS